MCITSADNVDAASIYHSYLCSDQFVTQKDILTQRARPQEGRRSDVIQAEMLGKVGVTHGHALNI